jgi:hypothetical protein
LLIWQVLYTRRLDWTRPPVHRLCRRALQILPASPAFFPPNLLPVPPADLTADPRQSPSSLPKWLIPTARPPLPLPPATARPPRCRGPSRRRGRWR